MLILEILRPPDADDAKMKKRLPGKDNTQGLSGEYGIKTKTGVQLWNPSLSFVKRKLEGHALGNRLDRSPSLKSFILPQPRNSCRRVE